MNRQAGQDEVLKMEYKDNKRRGQRYPEADIEVG